MREKVEWVEGINKNVRTIVLNFLERRVESELNKEITSMSLDEIKAFLKKDMKDNCYQNFNNIGKVAFTEIRKLVYGSFTNPQDPHWLKIKKINDEKIELIRKLNVAKLVFNQFIRLEKDLDNLNPMHIVQTSKEVMEIIGD